MAATSAIKIAINAGNPNKAKGTAHQNSSIYTITPKEIQYRLARKNPNPNMYPKNKA